jgi:DNA-binding protein H-NS
MLTDAEQRAKQVSLETASRLADLEQQLAEVRDQLESARAHIEEQVVSVRGQVEVARASLNTIRQQLTSAAATRSSPSAEPTARTNPVPRPTVPRLGPDMYAPSARARMEEEVAPTINDLRAAVDALKRPRPLEPVREASGEPIPERTEESTTESADRLQSG